MISTDISKPKSADRISKEFPQSKVLYLPLSIGATQKCSDVKINDPYTVIVDLGSCGRRAWSISKTFNNQFVVFSLRLIQRWWWEN